MQNPTDGRRARRQRTQRLILQTCRTLMQEGLLKPPVAEIARRAGLVQRTVYLSFPAIDGLRLQAASESRTRAAIADRILGGPGRAAAFPPHTLDRIVQAAVLGRCPT